MCRKKAEYSVVLWRKSWATASSNPSRPANPRGVGNFRFRNQRFERSPPPEPSIPDFLNRLEGQKFPQSRGIADFAGPFHPAFFLKRRQRGFIHAEGLACGAGGALDHHPHFDLVPDLEFRNVHAPDVLFRVQILDTPISKLEFRTLQFGHDPKK